MKRRTLLVLVPSAAVLLAALSAAPPVVPGAVVPEAAAQQQPPDLAADWAKQEDRALVDAGKKYESLFKWCVGKNIENTGNTIRRRVLRYQPDHEDVRKYYGYGKDAQTGKWVYVNEVRRDEVRTAVDIDDPKTTDLVKKVATAEKAIANSFVALAKKAIEFAKDKNQAANGALWKEREARSWDRVLQVDGTNEQAHKALGSPKFEGRFVAKFALPFVKVRAERKQAGLKIAQSNPTVKQVEVSGLFQKTGLPGAGAQSQHFLVNSSHGKDVAGNLAQWAERAVEDLVTIYGLDPSIKERLPVNRYDVLKDKDELEKLLTQAGWEKKRIKEHTEHFSGTSAESGEFSTHGSGGADSNDFIVNCTVTQLAQSTIRALAVQEHGAPIPEAEEWIAFSMGYDVTRRLTGTTITKWGAFGDYGNNMIVAPDKDIWIELAKLQVENDDDVEIPSLMKRKLLNNDMSGPAIVKGYALIQFLFESDPEKGRTFVKMALAQGTPSAALAVFGGEDPNSAVTDLEAKYREWISKSW